jgi:hypothetical protein
VFPVPYSNLVYVIRERRRRERRAERRPPGPAVERHADRGRAAAFVAAARRRAGAARVLAGERLRGAPCGGAAS